MEKLKKIEVFRNEIDGSGGQKPKRTPTPSMVRVRPEHLFFCRDKELKPETSI
jgi:hypothetical protein